MTSDWKTKTLGEIATIELGRTPARAMPSYWDPKKQTDNVWLSIADLQDATNGVVSDSKEYLSDAGAALCPVVPKGTLLVSFKLTLGRLAFAGRDLHTNEAIAALTLFDEHEIAKEYLFWFLRFFDWQKAAEGDLKIKGLTLNKAKLKALPIRFPRLTEQKRIVSTLEKAFAGLATVKAHAMSNERNARGILVAGLQAMFETMPPGWTESTLEQVTKFIDYRGRTPKKTKEGLRLITAKNVKMGHLRREPREFVAAASYNAWMTRGIPGKGDVIFTTEAPLANVAQLDTDERVVFAQRIIVMHADEKRLENTFLKYLLMSGPVQRRIHAKGTGATATGIKASLLKKIQIAFPTALGEQRRLIAKCDALSVKAQVLTQLYQRKVAALRALEESVLHQAFTGNL